MLEHNYYLMDFIDKMTRINKGRAFYTDPSQLGRYCNGGLTFAASASGWADGG